MQPRIHGADGDTQTRRDVVACIKSGEYNNIHFIHHIHDGVCEDVTNELLKESGFYDEVTI